MKKTQNEHMLVYKLDEIHHILCDLGYEAYVNVRCFWEVGFGEMFYDEKSGSVYRKDSMMRATPLDPNPSLPVPFSGSDVVFAMYTTFEMISAGSYFNWSAATWKKTNSEWATDIMTGCQLPFLPTDPVVELD